MRLPAIAAALALLPGLSLAEETGTATVNLDGTEYAAELWADQSDWSGTVGYGSVSLFFRATDRETLSEFSGFSLGFEFNGPNGTNPEMDVSKLVDGTLIRFYSDGDPEKGGLVVEIKEIVEAGGDLVVSGRAVGQFGPTENFGRTVDLSDPTMIEAQFSATVR